MGDRDVRARDALRSDGIGAAIHDAAEAAGLTPDDGAMLVRSFLSAGVDTTVSGIAFALRNLAANPDQWQLLRHDPSLTRNAFEETIRRESPVIGFFRMTTRPAMVGDVEIPAGHKVLLFYAGANRDPKRWADPDRFDIRRKVSGHLGYGIGIHACVGMVIARMEGDAVLGALPRTSTSPRDHRAPGTSSEQLARAASSHCRSRSSRRSRRQPALTSALARTGTIVENSL